MRIGFSICVAIILIYGLLNAGQLVNQSFKGTIVKTVDLKYTLYLPDGYDKPGNKTEYPLILFL
ncbi:MAG: hypothetical protein ACPL7O_11605, partial [Armatimonadota bacterium]